MAIDWDSLYELAPSDLTYVKDTDDAIRSTKTAVRERLTKEHEFDLAGQARQGLHRAGSAVAFYQASAPTTRNGVTLAAADAGLLFVDSDDKAAQVWSGSAFAGLKSAQATSLAGGLVGQIPYQSGANTTAFLAAGTAGYVLTGAGASAPVWTEATNANTASTIVKRDASGNFSAGTITAALTGTASLATSLAGGGAGQLPYQSGAGVTAMLAAGTTSQLLKGGTAPSWQTMASTNTASAVVQRDGSGNFSAGTISAALSGNATTATTSTNLAGGLIGQIPYQTGAGTTGFVAAGTAGYVLTGAGGASPTWTQATNANTINTIVKRDASGNFSAGTVTAALTGNATTATTATHLAGGGAGQIPYQSGAGATAMLAAGTTAQVLKGGTSPSWQAFASANTASAIVQRDASGNFSAGTITAALTGTASLATALAAGGAGQIPYQSGAGVTAFVAAGTAGYLLTGAGTSAPTWVEPKSTNTASTIVKRDASGNFSAGTVTAALSGNATTATTATHLAGGGAGQIPYQSGAGATAMLAAGTTAQVLKGGTSPSWQAFASTNTASAIVQRDASGNFAAGTITASLTGNVTGDVTGTATNATNVTVAQVSDNASYPIALLASAGAGNKAVKSDTSGGTYNPSTNTAAISISGDAATIGGYGITTTGDGIKSKHGTLSGGASAFTQGDIFTLLDAVVPTVGDSQMCSGSMVASATSGAVFNILSRGTSTRIDIIGVEFTSGAWSASTYSFNSGSAVAVPLIRLSW